MLSEELPIACLQLHQALHKILKLHKLRNTVINVTNTKNIPKYQDNGSSSPRERYSVYSVHCGLIARA